MQRPEMLLKIIHKEYTREGGDENEFNTSVHPLILFFAFVLIRSSVVASSNVLLRCV